MKITRITLSAVVTDPQQTHSCPGLFTLTREGDELTADFRFGTYHSEPWQPLNNPAGHAKLKKHIASLATIESLPLLRPCENFRYARNHYGNPVSHTGPDPLTPAFEHYDWWNHLTQVDARKATCESLAVRAPHGVTMIDMLHIRKWHNLIPKKTIIDFLQLPEGELHVHLNPNDYPLDKSHSTKGVFNCKFGIDGSFSRVLLSGKPLLETYGTLSKPGRYQALCNPETQKECVRAICTPHPKKGITSKQHNLLQELITLVFENEQQNKKNLPDWNASLRKHLKAEHYQTQNRQLPKIHPSIAWDCGFNPALPIHCKSIVNGYLDASYNIPDNFLNEFANRLPDSALSEIDFKTWIQLIVTGSYQKPVANVAGLCEMRFLPQIIAACKQGLKTDNPRYLSPSQLWMAQANTLFKQAHRYSFWQPLLSHGGLPADIKEALKAKAAAMI